MVKKGMAKKEDFRIVFKSGLLPGSPYAYLSDLPDDLKKAILTAFLEAPKKDKAAFDRLSDGKDKEFVPVYRDRGNDPVCQRNAQEEELIDYRPSRR
jgi:phosphonate transport system substrate-binding protein